MNAPYVKSNNSTSKLINVYYLALIPLILFGFYKNGIVLYKKGYIDFLMVFKPLIIVFISGIIGLVVTFINDKLIIRKKFDIKSSFSIIYAIIISMILPININIFYYSIILFGGLLLLSLVNKYININNIAIISLGIIYFFKLFYINNFATVYDKKLVLDFIDYIFGQQVGGIFSTNIFLIIIAYIILSRNNIYKKEIPLYIFIIFFSLSAVYMLVRSSVSIIPIVFNGFNLFSFVFIAPETMSSAYTKKGIILYSVLIAIISFVLVIIFKMYYGVFIAIFVSSLISKILKI